MSRTGAARLDAPNKHSRPEAFSEAYRTEDSQTLREHVHPVFQYFKLYEKGSGNDYTGRFSSLFSSLFFSLSSLFPLRCNTHRALHALQGSVQCVTCHLSDVLLMRNPNM